MIVPVQCISFFGRNSVIRILEFRGVMLVVLTQEPHMQFIMPDKNSPVDTEREFHSTATFVIIIYVYHTLLKNLTI